MNPGDVDLERRLGHWSGDSKSPHDLGADRDTQEAGDPRVGQRFECRLWLEVVGPHLLAGRGWEGVTGAGSGYVPLDQVAPRSPQPHGAVPNDDAALLDHLDQSVCFEQG